MEDFDPLFDNEDAECVALFKANRERDRKTWGKLLADKTFLQSRGYVVFKSERRISCDGRKMTRAQFVKLVDRVRRTNAGQ